MHWRFTIPEADIPSSSHAPVCPQLLLVKFELLFSELVDLSHEHGEEDVMKLIPEPLQLASVSLQNIGVQSITSGLHQYYSVTFDGDHFCALDTMFHACITQIHYHNIIPPKEMIDVYEQQQKQVCDELRDATLTSDSDKSTTVMSGGEDDNAASTPSTSSKEDGNTQNQPLTLPVTPNTTRRRASTTIATPSTTNTRRSSATMTNLFRFIASPEKALFPSSSSSSSSTSNSSNNSEETTSSNSIGRLQRSLQSKMKIFASNASSSNNQATDNTASSTSLSNTSIDPSTITLLDYSFMSLSSSQAQDIFLAYISPIILNYHRAVTNSQFIIDVYLHWKGSHETFQHSYDILSYNSLNPTSPCILLYSHQELVEYFNPTSSVPSWTLSSVVQLLHHQIHLCTTILSSRVNILFNALRRIMRIIKKTMKHGFVLEISSFWKQQMLIHTKR